MTVLELNEQLTDYVTDGYGNADVYINKDGVYYIPILFLTDKDDGWFDLVISDY
jgi:hypothetical protein